MSLIFGISEETKKEHLVKAALEAVCFQTRDILEAMNQDCGIPLTKLLVDGGMTVNSYAMQLQADLCGIPVVHPWMFEATALGAAMAAGSAEGIDVWDLKNMQPVPSDTYLPAISDDERDLRYAKWKMAIHRSIGWDLEASPNSSQNNNSSNGTDNILKLMPCGVFLMSSISLILLSQHFTC
ncbi:hypothetical protein J6590_068009 [Homalodisca vitripennis]|nr:hypothetical protein J6590_068009 [Homalodisca vitripennis]